MSCYDQNKSNCVGTDGCVKGTCPDFLIKRYDTKPDYRVLIEDCDGPLDLTDLVLEASMWANAKLKSTISDSDTVIFLADNIGFNQLEVGDKIVMDRVRNVEKMTILSIDEVNKSVTVQRAQDGTTAQSWQKGSPLKIIKFLDNPAKIEMVYEDVVGLDGTVSEDVLQESYFVYEWSRQDTLLPGCYFLEFKLIKMAPISAPPPSNPIEWIRRFPSDKEGFIVKVVDTFTVE